MKEENQWGVLQNLRYDIPASIVVFLVAVPLCLGIALASGAPLFSGIIAGIAGGLIVGAISGSPLGVSGPAAGLAVIVLSAIQELGAFETFLLAVVIAGIFQLLLGLLNAGIIGYYFPSAVIKGMLSGIGIIIVLKQIPHAFGYDKDYEGNLDFAQSDGHNTFSELYYMLEAVSPGAIIITLVSLAVLILWERPFIKRLSFSQIVPGPLVAVLAGVGLHLLFRQMPALSLNANQIVSLPVPDSLADFFGQFTLPDFSQWNNSQVYIIAATLAVVASIETLLSVEAVDKLDPYKRVTPANRELTAQGAGNIVSGLLGGLPVTQVIVRSSANVQSGGRTKASAIFHGALLLVSVMAIPVLLNLIPLASLAAVLFVVGYKLAKPSVFREMYALGKSQFIPYVVTIAGVVFTDLLVGIGLGMVTAIFHILWKNYKTPYYFDPHTYHPEEPIRIHLSEHVSFLNKAGIMNTLRRLPAHSHVIIDGSNTTIIHPDILEIIEDFKENARTRDIQVEVIGLGQALLSDPVKELRKTVLDGPSNGNGQPIATADMN